MCSRKELIKVGWLNHIYFQTNDKTSCHLGSHKNSCSRTHLIFPALRVCIIEGVLEVLLCVVWFSPESAILTMFWRIPLNVMVCFSLSLQYWQCFFKCHCEHGGVLPSQFAILIMFLECSRKHSDIVFSQSAILIMYRYSCNHSGFHLFQSAVLLIV